MEKFNARRLNDLHQEMARRREKLIRDLHSINEFERAAQKRIMNDSYSSLPKPFVPKPGYDSLGLRHREPPIGGPFGVR